MLRALPPMTAARPGTRMEYSFDPPFPIAILFPIFWVAFCYILAFGGWSTLAREFATDRLPSGRMFRFTNARMNRSNYANCVHVSVENDGILLKAILPFRLGHPPLFLPWRAIHGLTEEPGGHTVCFYAGETANVKVRLPRTVFDATRMPRPDQKR
jgi:hypothetical protein